MVFIDAFWDVIIKSQKSVLHPTKKGAKWDEKEGKNDKPSPGMYHARFAALDRLRWE